MSAFAERPPVEITKNEWMESLQQLKMTRAEMNQLVMNYLVTEGFKEAADKFRVESGVEPCMELSLLDNRIRIREAVLAGQIQAAIAMINDLYPELLDNNRLLCFHLQQQQLIELIRDKDITGALEYAQTHLAEKGEENSDIRHQLEQTLALLAFEEPESSPFGELMHVSQRQKVACELNAALLTAESQESSPKLVGLLKLLLWAQDELDNKKVKFPRLTDLARGTLEDPK
jgi:hypothetical protein